MKTCITTRFLLPMFLLIAVALPACRDSAPQPPVGISGQVVDAAGTPVSDVAIGLVYRFDGMSLPGDWEKDVIRPADKPRTQITFQLPEMGVVTLEILDYAGDRVTLLLAGELDAGSYSVTWDAHDDQGTRVPGGMYYYRLSLDNSEPVTKALFLYLYEDGEIELAPITLSDPQGRFFIDGALIPVGAETVATDETGQITGTATVSSAVLIKAVITASGQLLATSEVLDWVPGQRLGSLRLVLR